MTEEALRGMESRRQAIQEMEYSQQRLQTELEDTKALLDLAVDFANELEEALSSHVSIATEAATLVSAPTSQGSYVASLDRQTGELLVSLRDGIVWRSSAIDRT